MFVILMSTYCPQNSKSEKSYLQKTFYTNNSELFQTRMEKQHDINKIN